MSQLLFYLSVSGWLTEVLIKFQIINCLDFQGAVITAAFSRVGDLFASGGADCQVHHDFLSV